MWQDRGRTEKACQQARGSPAVRAGGLVQGDVESEGEGVNIDDLKAEAKRQGYCLCPLLSGRRIPMPLHPEKFGYKTEKEMLLGLISKGCGPTAIQKLLIKNGIHINYKTLYNRITKAKNG